jgi:hypothetical protein
VELLKYFFQCCFNESEGFDDLDDIIERFKKKETYGNQSQLIKELHQIIILEDYLLADRILKKYGNRSLDSIEEVRKFINYLYDRFLDQTTKVKAIDFQGNVK